MMIGKIPNYLLVKLYRHGVTALWKIIAKNKVTAQSSVRINLYGIRLAVLSFNENGKHSTRIRNLYTVLCIVIHEVKRP